MKSKVSLNNTIIKNKTNNSQNELLLTTKDFMVD